MQMGLLNRSDGNVDDCMQRSNESASNGPHVNDMFVIDSRSERIFTQKLRSTRTRARAHMRPLHFVVEIMDSAACGASVCMLCGVLGVCVFEILYNNCYAHGEDNKFCVSRDMFYVHKTL